MNILKLQRYDDNIVSYMVAEADIRQQEISAIPTGRYIWSYRRLPQTRRGRQGLRGRGDGDQVSTEHGAPALRCCPTSTEGGGVGQLETGGTGRLR